MPTKKKSANATARELPSIPQELIEQFVKGPMSAEGSISFFVFGLVRACRQAGPCFTSSVW
ncbi:hypothetical protein GSU75_03278 [Pseudomonas savastanoi pv. phaseolicola]|uniref:hypothetical protein n=1 Tax=Pseudomonas savastanoi TaxID=29438 RepID=UPI00197DA69B|nr:hypothetical protein [Pseudomonas savastanoi]MBN4176032.1 hypothetical protein [Pseudomonas savastanoi pv. phaseolicola]